MVSWSTVAVLALTCVVYAAFCAAVVRAFFRARVNRTAYRAAGAWAACFGVTLVGSLMALDARGVDAAATFAACACLLSFPSCLLLERRWRNRDMAAAVAYLQLHRPAPRPATPAAAPGSEWGTGLDATCARLARSYDLTRREEDVLRLLMEGRTFAEAAGRLADEGKTPLFFAQDGELLGIVAVADTVKPSSAAALVVLKGMGIRTVMLTGDNERTAAAIQREVGADEVIAGVLPDGKEREIRRLAEQGRVAMVGDGINDAPALARADVGIAIGAGTDVAIESADIVLMRNDLLDVPASIQLSRATLRNIKQNLFWALVYNAVCIPVAAGALSFMGLNLNPMIAAAAMSLSSVCVVTNALRLRGWKPDLPAAPSDAPASAPIDSTESDNPNEKESTMEKTLNVEGMMCQHCVAHVKRALESVEGVEEAVVDLDAGTATAKLAHDVPEDVLAAAIVEAGYEVK